MSMILQAWFPAQWDLVNVTESSHICIYYFYNVINTKPREKYAAKFCFQYHSNKLSVITCLQQQMKSLSSLFCKKMHVVLEESSH